LDLGEVGAMNSHQILRLLLSIVIGIAALLITSLVLFLAGIFLLMKLQIDFILSAQLVFLFVVSSLVGLIAAIFVGVEYYERKGKSES
jgi:hypothetical protein